MKYLFFLFTTVFFSIFTHAQHSNYSDLWVRVEKFEIDGLPKAALKIVETISTKAAKDKNHPQLIKTMLFKSKFALILEENAQLNIINDFKNNISTSKFPVKNILENILANLYWQYFNQHRWQFYNRTKTAKKVDDQDFRTWDLETLFNEIHIHYQASLQNGLRLQQEPLKKYDALLSKQVGSKILRPSLFDFLSNNALIFYKTSETHITRPAYKFEIDNPIFLAKAEIFSTTKITSKDSTSLQLHALKIYKSLIRFHLKEQSSLALTNVNIERLKFVNRHTTLTNKQDLLLATLKAESDTLKTHKNSGLYNFEIASIYFKQGQSYNPKTNKEQQWKTKEALELCNHVISKFPDSKGAKNCGILKSQIETLSLQITTEQFLPIQKNAKLLIRYKNLDALKFNAYKLSEKEYEKFLKIYKKDEQLKYIKTLNISKTWNNKLKNENDYQSHSTEVLIPKLDNGRHLIVAFADNKQETFAFTNIQVTNMALVETETITHKIFQVINRNNGVPIANTKIELSHNSRNNRKKIVKNYTSNNLGEFKIEKDNNWYNNVNLKVKSDNDLAFFGDFYINRSYNNQSEKKVSYKSFLFTDRSIYRPAQTIYFKAIAIKNNHEKSEVLENEKVYAKLYNTNNEEIKKLELTTNEFGSVSGEFILPNNGLNGAYRLEFNSNSGKHMRSNLSISVEEYKRPKFKTLFKPVTKTFKINDSITAKGHALAFSGSKITNAKVVYRVHRKVQYPRWYFWYRPRPNSSSQEITHGETTTNDKGEFKITFKAIPDQSVDKSSLPIFNYEVTANVTDLNGETRSATTIINVGYHALTANINIDDVLDKANKNHEISIDTKNLNGEFIPAKGTIKIYKLKAPNSVLRTRPWAAPDYQEFSQDTFKDLFPHDAYTDEKNITNSEIGELVFKNNFDTKNSKVIALGKIKKWQSGAYIIILETKDKFGQLVKDEIKTTLFSKEDKTPADNQLFTVSTDKETYNIGDMAYITFGSAAKNIFVTVSIEKDKKIIKTEIIKLNVDKKTIAIPVIQEDLGGFVVHYSLAAFNSFKTGTQAIVVPYPKTNLEIETLTFRDKLQPGTDETWQFKIKGPYGDKVSAELLASMYDASLNQFKPHNWYFKPIDNPSYYARSSKRANLSFGTQNFRIYNNYKNNRNYSQHYYDQLNWFGLNFSNNSWVYNNYLRDLRNKFKSRHTKVILKYDSSIEKGVFMGVVNDEYDTPLPGVNLMIKGTTTGTTTDFDGNFSIKAKKNSILTFSYIGFLNHEIKLNKNNHIKIYMVQDKASLEEVVVIGYATQKKESLTGAVSTVKSEDLKIPSANLTTALSGKVSGVKNQRTIYAEELSLEDKPNNNIDETNLKKEEKPNFDNIQIRKNLQETAFFFPKLKTDKDGNVSFNFTTPEALTQWKLQLLAHTKTLESTTQSLTTVTQKELMVSPNAPRFLREGDNITISTKIANLTKKPLSGQAKLILTNAVSGEDINANLSNSENNKTFTVDAEGNTQISWNLSIPDNIQAVQYKVVAKVGNFSDGEQNALPVLSNRMLVTETLPMWIRSNQTKTFTLNKLKDNTSTTLKNHKLTLEMTSNPAWYAVQALPYLMEYPYECNEQTFSRYYANALGSHITNSNPRIQTVFNQWKNTDALLSNLEKNEELKSILIQETPWLRDAQSETEQKKRMALLFDLNKMNNELESALNKLKTNQMASGGWSWFNGGRENRYITQHIITGFGHLDKLHVISNEKSHSQMIKKAVNYLDKAFIREYKDLKKYHKNINLTKDHLNYTQLHYLYMRSFFPDIKMSKEAATIKTYYLTQIQNYWLKRSLYSKGLMALISYRNNDIKTATKILKSLKETSITSDELGMYWKTNANSWYWYQAPIETQALLIEVFSEIGDIIQDETKNIETIDNLKIWLLKNKQTNKWKTTKATTEAVYALLLQGSDWLNITDMVDVVLGGQQIEPSKLENVKVEAGTGYYKTAWNTTEIKPEMGDVKITKKGNGIAWGSLYWQYFEDLDKITSAETPLKLKKKLFLKTNTNTSEEITEITTKTNLKVGDLVRVRIELRSDRNMEFIHMKDMRASGLEPVNVISKYKWQDGLGYYESTKDASTNFFFDYLPKGVYVFEYDLRVNNAGNMSNGITTIQSMYAPEFSSHSKGVRLLVN